MDKKYMYNHKRKSMFLGALLNTLFVGAGEIYAGKTGKGIAFLLVNPIIFFIGLYKGIHIYLIWTIIMLIVCLADIYASNKILKMELE